MIIGIDPGLKGGVAGVSHDGPIFSQAMPVAHKAVDVLALRGILEGCPIDIDRVIVEQQTIYGKQAGAITIGANYGRILATIELLQLPYAVVTPARWGKAMGIPAGLKGRAKKEAAHWAAQKLWGARFLDLGLRPTQDGPVEATLIAGSGYA